MSSSMCDELKELLSEVELFLSVVLKTASLPKHVTNEKDELVKRIKLLREEYPELQSGISGKSGEPVNKETSVRPGSEIYDDIEPHQAQSGSGSGSYGTTGKPPSLSGSEGSLSEYIQIPASVSQVTLQQQPALVSVTEVQDGASISGVLVKKLHGKAKDIKSMASKLIMAVAGKKYCVASGGILYLFDKQTSKKQSEAIILKGYEVSVSTEPSTKKEFLFEMVGPGQKSYTFAASTEDEVDKWVTALNEESLKTPNLRIAVEEDNDEDGEDYEDAEEVVSRPAPSGLANKRIPKPPVGNTPSGPPPVTRPQVGQSKGARQPSYLDDDGELYDDIVTSDDHDDIQEVYDDAQSKDVQDDNEDGLIYEDYDDIKEQMLAASKNTQKSLSQNPASPPLPPLKGATASNNGAALPARPSEVKAIRAVVSPKQVPVTAEPVTSPQANQSSVEDYPNMYYGKWDCQAEDANEIAFKYGDIITVLSREYEKFGWWVGQLNGSVGLVPCGYLTPAYELVSG